MHGFLIRNSPLCLVPYSNSPSSKSHMSHRIGRVLAEAVRKTESSVEKIKHADSFPTFIVPPSIGWGHPTDRRSKTYSIVIRPERKLATFASFIRFIAGLIAVPFPIPGRPTRIVYKFGYKR